MEWPRALLFCENNIQCVLCLEPLFFGEIEPTVNILVVIIQALLWIWFLGCTTTYRFGKILLVEGEGIKSAEFFALCLYSAGLIAYHAYLPVGRWVLLGVLLLWAAVQFRCHWYYTIFGASERKLQGYNDCFRGKVRIFRESDTRLVPDMYHIVLHLLILANIVGCFLR